MLALSIVAVITAILGLWAALARSLMMLQQNSYRQERFLRWVTESQDTTSTMHLVSLAVVFAALSTLATPAISCSLVIAVSVANFLILIRRKYKKPLVWTRRAKRIFMVGMVICLVPMTAILIPTHCNPDGLKFTAIALLLLSVISHFVVIGANWLLKPIEKHINANFRHDAERILSEMPDLKIVGITGSYGKTSTKHFLHRILSEKFDVVMTPGSFNTTLGVIRTIRENLKPYNQVFIVEMGAKQPGDIADICELVHPQTGIITAVGEQHLESFKTIERVRDTKFELVDALPESGLAVVNNDFPYAAGRVVNNVDCTRYAVTHPEQADYWASDIEYTPNGTKFTLNSEETSVKFETRLMGECNVSNLIAAIIVALSLGVEMEKVKFAVARIEPVEHRLSVKRTPGGVTILDDAFNSNPMGSSMALDVLKSMTGGKRIIITPGMIELGDRQFEANKEFGHKISNSADIAIIVGRYNREAIVQGIEEGKGKAEIILAETFKDAQKILGPKLRKGDTVLYENDLPDTFK